MVEALATRHEQRDQGRGWPPGINRLGRPTNSFGPIPYALQPSVFPSGNPCEPGDFLRSLNTGNPEKQGVSPAGVVLTRWQSQVRIPRRPFDIRRIFSSLSVFLVLSARTFQRRTLHNGRPAFFRNRLLPTPSSSRERVQYPLAHMRTRRISDVDLQRNR